MRGSGYNLMRDDAELLAEHAHLQSSFSIHLYPEHWTLNNGPKFLYNKPVSSLLDDIRAFRIPSDFIELFHAAKVPYYDGCLIVELLDYRPLKAREPVLEKPDVQRVVLRPSPETLWADICILNQRSGYQWTDMDALEIESRLLMSTAPPLCLDPDPHLTRIVNNIVRVSTPNTPHSLKRKAALVDLEEDETDKAKRAKVMQFMNPQANKPTFHPSYHILMLKERRAAQEAGQPQRNTSRLSSVPVVVSTPSNAPTPVSQASTGQDGVYDDSNKKKAKGTAPTPVKIPTQLPPQPISNGQQPSPATMQPATHLPGYAQPNPPDPNKRMSPAKQKTQLPASSPHTTHSQQQASQQAGPSNSQPPQPQQPAQQPLPFQPPIPPASYLSQPPIGKKKPPQQNQGTPTPSMPSQPLPQQQTGQPQALPPSQQQPPANMAAMQAYMHAQQLAAQRQQMLQAQQAHAQAQNGRNTPNMMQNGAGMTRSPMISNQQTGRGSPMINNQQGVRSSPLVSNQPLAGRNAMPLIAQQQHQQQQQHQAQQQQQQTGHNLNYPVSQNQLNQNHLRAMAPHLAQHFVNRPQATPSPGQQGQHMQQPQQQSQPGHPQPSQDQTSAAQMLTNMHFPPQMFNYTQMGGMGLGVPPGAQPQYAAWGGRMGIGRGTPQVMNGQQPLPPGMAHLQQMPGMGRTLQGGLQGR